MSWNPYLLSLDLLWGFAALWRKFAVWSYCAMTPHDRKPISIILMTEIHKLGRGFPQFCFAFARHLGCVDFSLSKR